jgi:NADPH:quinone reductase-like Zn-dependent oxidoreductase
MALRDFGIAVRWLRENTEPATTVWMPAPSDEGRGVRGIDLYVRNDAEQLSRLVALVDRGELPVDVAQRVPLAELPAVHARAAAGTLAGKVVVLPPAA